MSDNPKLAVIQESNGQVEESGSFHVASLVSAAMNVTCSDTP